MQKSGETLRFFSFQTPEHGTEMLTDRRTAPVAPWGIAVAAVFRAARENVADAGSRSLARDGSAGEAAGDAAVVEVVRAPGASTGWHWRRRPVWRRD